MDNIVVLHLQSGNNHLKIVTDGAENSWGLTAAGKNIGMLHKAAAAQEDGCKDIGAVTTSPTARRPGSGRGC